MELRQIQIVSKKYKEEPKNLRHLQQVLGICNFYRRFVIKHNNYITPFRDLLRTNADWLWTEKHKYAYRALKENFARAVCLSHIIPGVQFKVQTDASIDGIAGVLYQIDDEKHHRIVSLVSRCLTSAESRYMTTELELLTIVYSVTKFRQYLIGEHFEIITDHKSLTFLNSTMFHNARLIRWNLLLQQYSYSVSYCRGADNIMADFLSRNPGGKFKQESNDKSVISSLQKFCSPIIKNEVSPLVIMALFISDASLNKIMKNIKDQQMRDEICKKIIDDLIKNNNNVDFQVYEGVLFHKEQKSENWHIVIPSELKVKIVEQTHSKLGHPGVYKTLSYLKKFYYWKTMAREVKRFVLTCDL